MNCLAPSSTLDAAAFASATGRGLRTAQRAFSAGLWDGIKLPLVPATGRGGKGGMRLVLDLSQASPELLAAVPGLKGLRAPFEGASEGAWEPAPGEAARGRNRKRTQECLTWAAEVVRRAPDPGTRARRGGARGGEGGRQERGHHRPVGAAL